MAKKETVTLIGEEELYDLLDEIANQNGELQKKMRSAVNRVVNKYAKPYLEKMMQENFSAKQSAIDENSDKIRKSKATNGTGAILRLKSNRIPLSGFRISPDTPPSQKGIPISKRKKIRTKVRKNKDWTYFKHAFLARFKSGHAGMFERDGGITKTGKARLRELYSLSVSEIARRNIADHGNEEDNLGLAEFRKELTEQMRKSVERAKKKYYKKLAKEAANG